MTLIRARPPVSRRASIYFKCSTHFRQKMFRLVVLLLVVLPGCIGGPYTQSASDNAVENLKATVEAIVLDWKACHTPGDVQSTTQEHPAACNAMYDDLQTAYMTTYRSSAAPSITAPCFAMMSVLSAPFMPRVTRYDTQSH